MNGHFEERKSPLVAGIVFGLVCAITRPAQAETSWGQALHLIGELRPTLVDYELPGHPRQVGRGHTGTIGTLALRWTYEERIRIEAGVLARLAFAHDFQDELGAFPLLSVTLTPFGPWASLRLGSLNIRHGFHPAVLDEDRYAYGRNYEETYNRSLVPEARQDLGGDPFMPVESGAQLVVDLEPIHAELYLDWQLLETTEHREKFAVGVLAEYRGHWVDAGFHYRLVHYGGQQFTQLVEARRLGLDAKRQPTSLAAFITPKPLHLGPLRLELPVTFLQGRLVQTPGGREASHRGLELGADVWLYDALRLGYRVWLPKDGVALDISEDGDPTYSGPRSHRATVQLVSVYGPAELSGRLDLVFAEGSDKVQYLTVTTLTFRFEPELWVDTPLP